MVDLLTIRRLDFLLLLYYLLQQPVSFPVGLLARNTAAFRQAASFSAFALRFLFISQVMVSLYSHSFLFDPVFRLLLASGFFLLTYCAVLKRDRRQHFVSPIMSGFC